jgi:hypothetical protein
MPIWLKASAVAALLAVALTWNTPASASPNGKPVSTSEEVHDPARRIGYRTPAGARRLGDLYPNQAGDQVAFFEERNAEVELVVAIAGGAAARWAVSRDTARLSVFWIGPSEIILGTDVLAPKMRVKWYVARAG